MRFSEVRICLFTDIRIICFHSPLFLLFPLTSALVLNKFILYTTEIQRFYKWQATRVQAELRIPMNAFILSSYTLEYVEFDSRTTFAHRRRI